MIESRFFTTDEANRLCSNGIRLFLSNESVTKYNNLILNNNEDKMISLSEDVYSGCHNTEHEAFVKIKLHKMSTINTGGLPYEIVLVIDKYYILTTNIDVSDGLANGAVGKLCYVDRNELGEITKITKIWLKFPKNVGKKLQKKYAGYLEEKNIDRDAVPIMRRTSTISLNSNKTILARRNHFPLVSSCAITIHKSQGGTFNEIVYEYQKNHCLQLVYVALSRVTCVEGLYITTKDDSHTFFHGRRESTSVTDLENEFKRLSLNKLQTISSILSDLISSTKGLSFFTINCQSIHPHKDDFNKSVLQEQISLFYPKRI